MEIDVFYDTREYITGRLVHIKVDFRAKMTLVSVDFNNDKQLFMCSGSIQGYLGKLILQNLCK